MPIRALSSLVAPGQRTGFIEPAQRVTGEFTALELVVERRVTLPVGIDDELVALTLVVPVCIHVLIIGERRDIPVRPCGANLRVQ